MPYRPPLRLNIIAKVKLLESPWPSLPPYVIVGRNWWNSGQLCRRHNGQSQAIRQLEVLIYLEPFVVFSFAHYKYHNMAANEVIYIEIRICA